MHEMKDSGIEWIGNIPVSWKIVKVKYNFTNKKDIAGILADDYERLALTMNGVIKRSKEDNNGLQPEKFETYQVLNEGELVFKLIDLQNVSTSRVGLSPFIGLVSPAYIIIKRNGEVLSEFAEKFFLSMWKNQIFNAMGDSGVRSSLNTKDLLEIQMVFPSESEQKAIADYLDSKCAELDNIISDIQSQIETLEEYKRSVITEAVTKGLDPDVEMRDSGVQWIGTIPKHWTVDNPKWHFVQRKDRATKGLTQLTASQKYGVVTQEEYMEITGAKVVTVEKDFDILKLVCPGDFIIHMRSFQGGLEYSEKYGSISSAYVMLIPQKTILEPRFYKWFFKSPVYIDALSSTSNLIRDGQAMRYANFIQLPIPLMPKEEQQQIADYLDMKCAEIDSIIAEKKQQIETIEEYKKSLIFEYVTGKKEVV